MKIGYFTKKDIRNNVSCFLEERAEKHPNKVALYFLPKSDSSHNNLDHNTLTYGELNNKAASIAAGLVEMGVKIRDRIMILLPISPELYISIAGIQRVGAIPVLLDSWARKEQLAHIFNNAQPMGIISTGNVFQLLNKDLNDLNIKLRISIDPHDETLTIELKNLLRNPGQKIVAVEQNDTALITYTTGSSGLPKGANRTHRFLAAQHYALKRLFPYRDGDIDLPVFPVFALNSIASGVSTVLPSIDIGKPAQEDFEVLFHQIQNCGVNCMTLSPSSFRGITAYCKTKGTLLKNISRVLTGGAPISETDISRFVEVAPDSEVWILYGSTEVEPIAYIESKEMLSVEIPKGELNITKVGVNVGRIDQDLKYRFIEINKDSVKNEIDVTTLIVKSGEVGELIVAGEHVCDGYYKNEEAFLRTKIKDKEGVIWHRTGDLGRLDDNGYLWIVGRMHNVIKHNGEYFFPVRPEIILKDLPLVLNAAYLSVDLNTKDCITAVVTFERSVATDSQFQETYRQKIVGVFQKEQIPLDNVIFMEEIPMDVRHHSKVDYNKLRNKLHDVLA